MSFLALTAFLCTSALTLSACSASDSSASAHGPVKVVASTNVYGDLVDHIGGDRVEVTSLIDSPDKDPHEYQATARDQLAISSAALIVENGGGYDPFIDTMRAASSSSVPVVMATVVADGPHADINEHVWYDFGVIRSVVTTIADKLSTIDPSNSSTYSANAATLTGDIGGLIEREKQLKSSLAGRSIAITEPVPLYLTDALGLTNLTPEAVSEAIEQGTDIPAALMQQTRALFSDRKVAALIYNQQTEGAQTTAMLDAAKAAGIPAVGVTETLPDGTNYVGWMTANLNAIQAALSQ
ncbi:ABC transporter substrate-binding protein [Rathayibacter toxicus]|uniref:ABC transporter substrate-binding protein n=1 Tax=Rathayibacter toxicus TaxID=145458 RepID=A0A0C5BUD9_9MICO|nr:hypothetical protein TI83_01600 [Rathayibacter toxicus]KKM46402.1 hypothetical protein VT73_02615 [Rathayibacter toxicus]PPG23391.1 ABC transporter substrate-binding protein [Rathayibacter toxicus]PPG47977.1 ABC transporter substrate-binding protein [Rathayibacter toxicus]PPH25125.1 ABC transporter substrate-binding protein [Rathayibacter toxicus]